HRVFEHTALLQIFEQRAETKVEHGADQVAVAFDGAERRGPVDVPGDLIEYGFEHVYSAEADAPLDETARQKAALAELVHAVGLPQHLGLLAQIEGFSGRFR